MSLKNFFRKYPEIILTTLALVLLGFLIALSSWGIGNMFGAIDRIANPSNADGQNANFNLKGAQSLDLRGLVK